MIYPFVTGWQASIVAAGPCHRLTSLLRRNVASLAANRIVWRPIDCVGNTVAIAIALVPASAFQLPPGIALRPGRLRPVVARALTLPMPGFPHVAIAVRVPIAWRPHIAIAWRGNRLIASRWRRAVEIDANVGSCRHRNGDCAKRRRTQNGDQWFAEFHTVFLGDHKATTSCNPYVEFVLARAMTICRSIVVVCSPPHQRNWAPVTGNRWRSTIAAIVAPWIEVKAQCAGVKRVPRTACARGCDLISWGRAPCRWCASSAAWPTSFPSACAAASSCFPSAADATWFAPVDRPDYGVRSL